MNTLVSALASWPDKQQELIALVESHRANFEEFVTRTADVREENAALLEMRRQAADTKVFPPEFSPERQMKSFADVSKAAAEETQLDARFILDASSLFEPIAPAQWAEARRVWLWERVNRFTPRAPGSRMNLVEIVDRLGLTEAERSQIAPLLNEYQSSIEHLLANMLHAAAEHAQEYHGNYFKDLTEMQSKARAVTTEERDRLERALSEKWTRKNRKKIEAQVAVRNVNQAFADRIAEQLPARVLADFTSACARAKYPDVYPQQTHASLAAQRLRTLPDLTPDQSLQLDEIMFALSGELASQARKSAELEERLFDVYWHHPNDLAKTSLLERELEERREERRQLSQRAIQAMRKMLTPDQQEAAERLGVRSTESEQGSSPAAPP